MSLSLLRLVHRWLGLLMALPLLAIVLSGLFMMVTPLVSAVTGDLPPNGPLSTPSPQPGIDAAAILALARPQAPELLPVRWRLFPDGVVAIGFAAAGRFQPAVQVEVETGTRQVVAVRRDPDRLYRWMQALHETLLAGPAGRAIVGWSGVALLALGLTGIPLWWPPRRRWRSGFTVPVRARGYRLQRGLHGATGIWWLGLLLLQAVSGITLAFPQTVRTLAGLGPPAPRAAQPGGQAAADPFQAMVAGLAAAQSAEPGAILQELRRPAMPGRPMMALLLPAERWAGSPAVVVTMDPATARVLSVRTNGPAATLLGWLRAIHEGGAAGPLGRGLMCLFGLSLLGLPVTGTAMWVLRRHRRRQAMAPATATSALRR